MNDRAAQRANALLRELSPEEKIYQVTAEMIFDTTGDYRERRNPLCGAYRNPGHFMHYQRPAPASPAEVTAQINEDVRCSIEAQPHGIPPIENGEALHGAQWGMCTNFPQPIALASSFDPALVERVGDAIGKECSAAGVRQVFSPVVNLARDCRWGRTVETYGEDVQLTSDLGAAMCRGLQKNGVIATPKHFADNYGFGGRDSNYAETGERAMRETVLPPFRACIDAGAQSVMAAYNGWDGLPCTANRRLLTEILRDEWGFDGFVVSDYCGVEGLREAHKMANTDAEAAALALKAGLDVILPFCRYDAVKEAIETGALTEAQLDVAVLRVLTAKFRLGLFEQPYRDPDAAQRLVRCDAHRALALEAARASIVLLKNDGILPLKQTSIKRIGVFGQSAKLIPIGANYSGPYGAPWQGADAPTPLEALQARFGDSAQILFCESSEIEAVAPTCDVNLYFTSILEGEGSDRSDLRLPSVTVKKEERREGGLIVDEAAQEITDDQERSILRLCKASRRTVILLQNGAPIDMTAWAEQAPAILETWYPGEQGAKALVEILFGETNPSAKLPITIPKSVGQLPLVYSRKPSGRGYAYCDNDGKPLYPFGFGLSYTSFEISDVRMTVSQAGVDVAFRIANTGVFDGAEVVQLYLGSHGCAVVRPMKALKAYARVALKAGECKAVSLHLTPDAFCYYDAAMVYGLHDGSHTLMLGVSSEEIRATFELTVRGGSLRPAQQTQADPRSAWETLAARNERSDRHDA
ncbi:MAG: glycoside hydrolase family 3 C-terminal domain-containing protein [Clostridia bacterium]|nr:glycoside hydrolase family 3 C-terminal domain-containing protein [Clostridia bacterium]